ncbi:hypothetical protein HML84_16030 [Alcanivorax sp. IO_7]|nr:hypothetical protein HML84_16030 [Alcanivorax sp. IO_7]
MKDEALLKNIQSLIVTFANIHATAKQDWSTGRIERLRSLAGNLRYAETVIKSLNPSIGAKVERWRISSDADNESIQRVVEYILGGLGAIIGDKYDDFLFSKAEDLRRIQDDAFEDISS